MLFEAGDDKNDAETALRKKLAALDVRRQSMESEAEGIISELTTSDSPDIPPMGIDTPLVDKDGYPRGDVDVYRARTLRHRLAILKTDHKSIMEDIEQLLIQLSKMKRLSSSASSDVSADIRQRQEAATEEEEKERRELEARTARKPKPKYDSATGRWVVMNWDGTTAGIEGGDQIRFEDLDDDSRSRRPTNDDGTHRAKSIIAPSSSSAVVTATVASTTTNHQTTTAEATAAPIEQTHRRPFARINAVALDSPAMAAGLREDDLITRFGYIHADNHQRLTAIAALVPDVAVEEGTIEVDILRRKTGSSNDDGGSDNEEHTQSITVPLRPRPWDGQGLLGCHIVPYHG